MQLEAKAVSFSNPFFKGCCWFIHQWRRCILREIVQQPSLLENRAMSIHPQPIGRVPEDTARVARAAFPKGTTYIRMRDVLGAIYDDEDFAQLFEVRGRPAIAPWRLALVTVMQFAEGLSDRQAAEAVRARIDWKYALGLELTDPGSLTSPYSRSSAPDWWRGAPSIFCSNRCLRRARSVATSRPEADSARARPTCSGPCAS
jgi:transposase-like protein DUF772